MGALLHLEQRIAGECGRRRQLFRKAHQAQGARLRQGLTHACSRDDMDARYQWVIGTLRGARGAPIISGFREGDKAEGRWVQHPPAAVRGLGGRILAQVNRSNQRRMDINAVHAWHEVFVPRYPEVKAPGGGEWKA